MKGMKSDICKMASTSNDFDINSVEFENFASSREMKGINSKEKSTLALKQIVILKDEKSDLEQQLKDKDEEVKRLTVELDTANKSIYDKERQQK